MLNSAAADAAGIKAYLSRFVPNHRRQLLRKRHAGEPATRALTAVVLYVDIVGFTALSGQMTQNLAVGAEKIAEGVNGALTGIAGIAARHGGEVLYFAGDAAWIGWFVSGAADLPDACHLAAAAAVAVREVMGSWDIGGRPVQLRASLGTGELQQLELGGHRDQWCGLLRGPAIADAVGADRFGSAGTIVASPSVWRYLAEAGEGTSLPRGYVRIETVGPVQAPVAPIERVAGTDGAALPEMIAHRAGAGELGQWSGEFRTCHVVFCRFHTGDVEAGIGQLQLAVGEIQRVLERSNGSLYQLLSDEKGLAVIAAYGLPPQASGTDGARALGAVALLNEALGAYGIESHFGVAVGRVFCTTYGAGNQLQFALVGPALNRAARLADAPESITVDTAIVEAGLPASLIATALPTRTVKGIAEPVLVSAISRRKGQHASTTVDGTLGLVGRANELADGIGRLAELARGQGGLLLIEGDPGVGKSILAASVLAAAAARSLTTARGGADEIERATEYRPWRRVLATILADAVDADGRLSQSARASLGGNLPYAGLLSRLLNVAPDPDAADARLTDEARATLVRQMTVDLLAARSRQGPFVLLLEDLHWFDSPSLALLEAILEAQLPMLVIATTRSDDRTGDLLNGPGRERIALGGLHLAQSTTLLAQTCGTLAVDDSLATNVHNISSGNPLFITQLGRFLLDNGRVEVKHGRLQANDDTLSLERAFEAHGVPATLEGVVMARLDALPPADRETARVASVLGGGFSHRDLDILLGGARDLSQLIDAGVLAPREAVIDFRHAILRDVAYSTLSLADRRRWHRAVAGLLLAKPEAAAGQLDAVLAYHQEQAGDLESAIAYGLNAAVSSLRGNANREALAQSVHGLDLLTQLPPEGRAALRGSGIELELSAGEAAQRLSLYDEAVRHKDTALAGLGGAIPVGGAAVAALLREVAAQVIRRRAPWSVRSVRPGPGDLRLSAETAELVEIYFYRGESLRSLYAALRALNLAEGGGDTPQLARGFGIVGTIAGFARLSGIAKSYGERALDVLSRIDDPGAAWWVPLVVGVSRLSAGDLATASRLMEMTAIAADRIRDRRHWRDAIGNQSIVFGLRGDWNAGLRLSEQYLATAIEDRDTRYVVAAARERAYYLLQLGRLDEAAQNLTDLRAEIEQGLKAEEGASRQDLHAIASAIALARGDLAAARREAEAGYAVLQGNGSSSFPNMFWSLSLLFEAYLRLAGTGASFEEDRARAWSLVRALDKHAASHLIGKPAALRARGLYERRFGWAAQAGRWLDLATETAGALGMALAPEPAQAGGNASPLARLMPPWFRRGQSPR